MSTHFGDIDIAQIIDNEFKAKLALKLVEWVFNHPQGTKPSQQEVEEIKNEILKELQKKYPNSGVKLIE